MDFIEFKWGMHPKDTRLTNERLALLCFKLAVLLLLLIGRSVFAAAQLKRQST